MEIVTYPAASAWHTTQKIKLLNEWLLQVALWAFLPRYFHPRGKKIGRKHAILCSHSLGQGQPFCFVCVSQGTLSLRFCLQSEWTQALTELLASMTAWIVVKISHSEVLPASAPALLYKAKTVAPLHVTVNKNNYNPCVIQSSTQLLCKLSHSCTFILTVPLSATPQLSPEGRVGTQGNYCHHLVTGCI